MLKARAAAGGAAAIAAVGAELAGGVAALARQGGVGKDLAQRVPGAHVADRVGARGLANRRLVNKHHVTEQLGAQQPVMGTWGFGGPAKVAQQRWRQDVLHQGRLARAADAGDTHQALQRQLDRDVFQVVLARAFEHQARRVVGHQPRKAQPDLAPPAQVGAGQGVGLAQVGGAAVKHNLAAPLAWAGAHVDHAVGRQHHRRVMLHHHQGVAGVAQPLHGHNDAVHVARVQADAGLVQHKQGVDQRGAQGRGEVDALHLAARQGAALPVQREVADADLAQVLEPGADLVKQQFEGLQLGLGRDHRQRRGIGCQSCLHGLKKPAQPVQRHQHQVVQAQARQRFELLARPAYASRQKALGRRQHGVGIGATANAPEQALGLQAGTAAHRAGGVAAVLGQQHPDVHLVRLGLQVLKKTFHAKPVLVPLAVPLRRAVDHPVLLLGCELVPGGVARDAGGFGVAHQVVLGLLPGRGLDRLDGPGAQRELVIGDHQAVIDADHPAEAAAGVAGANRRVEGKHRGDWVGVAQVAVGAVQTGGELP